ncbi:acyl-CoA dehydrogenase family protein [Saccharopolyspora griseoalba]|uniref:Acyl-CoA dehydrogenase family protein n=1 Tax=Saccharopolyspora griseoalba TaxID=1431848 RepID=A0ABW2LDE8_9PSEU
MVAEAEPDAEFISAAEEIRPTLAAERADGEQRRALTDAAVRAMDEAGVFRAWVPRRFGGSEHGLETMMAATAEVCRGDPSAGWLALILGSGDWLVGLFPDAAQEDVFGDDPATRICQVLTPKAEAVPVDGGWRVSGRWAPASGCLHSQWAMLGVTLPDDAAFALVPMNELTVHDTWFTLGMRATGSNLLSGEDLFVPEHRVLRRSPALRGEFPRVRNDSPRYRVALVPTLITFLIAPMVAMAEQALEHVVSRSGERGVPFTSYRAQRDSTAFQLAVAEAATKIDVSRLIARDNAASLEGHARAGTHPEALERARLRRNAAHAVRQCREAVDELVSAVGAGAVAESDPLESLLRDIQTASRHAIAHPSANAEVWARELLGIDPNISQMI